MNSKTSAPPLVISVGLLAGIFIVLLAMRATSDILAPIPERTNVEVRDYYRKDKRLWGSKP